MKRRAWLNPVRYCVMQPLRKSVVNHGIKLASRPEVAIHQHQPKVRVEFSAIMCTATGQTCNCTFNPTHARKIALAIWTPVKIAASTFADWEREIMTAPLIANPKIAASLPPLNTMGQNPAPARAKLGKDMGQFVAQRLIDFGWMLKQPRIQRDEFLAIISATSGRSQT